MMIILIVSIIPGIGTRYVPKPAYEPKISSLFQNTWRKSLHGKEKNIIRKKIVNGTCHLRVLKLIDTIFKRDSNLRKINGFYLKTVLFHSIDQGLSLSCTLSNYHLMAFDIMGFVQQYLEMGNLPHFYIQSLNLFHDFKKDHIVNMKNRIKNLRTGEQNFLKAVF